VCKAKGAVGPGIRNKEGALLRNKKEEVTEKCFEGCVGVF
jgi:hypothetical protein